MTYSKLHVRSGLTAIAAVLALSSTPLLAQEVTTPPDPVAETPSEPAPAADALAPEPAAEPAASETAPEAEPAATAAPATTRRASTRARTTATNRAPSEPVQTAAPASPSQLSDAVAGAVPVPPPGALPAVTDPFAPAGEPVAEVEKPVADETLPIAGAAGLGLLALGGLGLAMQRRRRRREELEHFRANQAYLDKHPVEPARSGSKPAFFQAEQASVATSAPEAAVRTDVPRTKLPEDFDLSRFGPHVRAAYLGPTPDNPSLSLKYRLRRAGAMDQQARIHGEAPQEAVKTAAPRPGEAKKPMWVARNDGFMLRQAGDRQPSKPAFQH